MSSHLPRELTVRESFLFPVGTPEARRDILIGGLAVAVLLPFGWILNLGARLDVVARLFSNAPPYFRGFQPIGHTFKRGCVSALAIFCYLLPANIFFSIAIWQTYSESKEFPYMSGTLGLLFFVAAGASLASTLMSQRLRSWKVKLPDSSLNLEERGCDAPSFLRAFGPSANTD